MQVDNPHRMGSSGVSRVQLESSFPTANRRFIPLTLLMDVFCNRISRITSCTYFTSVILTLYFFSFSMLSHSRGPLGTPSFAYYSQLGSDHSPGELILQLDGS